MYASLDKLDLEVDGPRRFVQTDQRGNGELAETPELTTLFALARVLNPRRLPDAGDVPVVYVVVEDEPPACLLDALGATGALLQVGTKGTARPVPAGELTADELADRAFRGLAQRVARRVGLTDMATVLRALEAETTAEPPRQDEDEPGYWGRVLELAAVTCEVVRARSGGRWEIHHHADLPFGFATRPGGGTTPAGAPGAGGIILATNRAHRFLADGEDESMFDLLTADREVSEGALEADDLPILPNLRARGEARTAGLAFRPLFTGAPEDDRFPVVVYGHDTPQTFGAFRAERAGDLDVLHDRALANLAGQEVTVEELELEGMTVIAVSGSFYAAEKLLDRGFLRGLHRQLGHDVLAASAPRRGLAFFTAVTRADKREVLALKALTVQESRTTRAISDALLIVKEGELVGHIVIDDGPTDEPPAPPPKKQGWLARLFGRKK